jgi:DNA-binding Lrp family transcriptional regulator
MKLDKLDRSLLRLVQRDAWMTAEQMAEQVPLSASAIQRRLQRLRKDGVILGATAILDPAKIGRPSFFVVSLEVERERPELLSQLRSWLSAQDEVQHAFYATGSADFVLLLTAPDPESYEEFMTGLMSSNPNVRRFSTNVVLSVVKRSLLIPVPNAEVER